MTSTDAGNAGGRDIPRIISVDDHIVEPPHVFERWLPRKYQDRAPKVVRRGVAEVKHTGGGFFSVTWDDDAPLGDCWLFEQFVYVQRKAVIFLKDVDMTPNLRTFDPCTYEDMRPGCYDPTARLVDMDLNHVEASLGFPSFPRFCGQVFTEQTTADRELGMALIRAYNDWHVEEWCGDSGGRLIPLIVVPLWDAELAAQEIRRNADRGVRAVAFSEIPYHLGAPSIHSGFWDPFFRACAETGTVVCMHIGSSSKMPATSPDAPQYVAVALSFNNSMASLADYIFSGRLEMFPGLQLAYSEGQIGWLPYMLERMDNAWLGHDWAAGDTALKELPSFYFRRQVTGCFFNDHHGVRSLDEIGVDNVTFETDYPHGDSTFPHTKKVFSELTQALDDESIYKIARGNAIRLFGLGLDRERIAAPRTGVLR